MQTSNNEPINNKAEQSNKSLKSERKIIEQFTSVNIGFPYSDRKFEDNLRERATSKELGNRRFKTSRQIDNVTEGYD